MDYNVLIEKDTDGYYVASVPELQGCHTQGKTMDEAMERIKETITLFQDMDEFPPPRDFVGMQRITV